MAHYAYINESNIVTNVIVGKNEGEGGVDWEQYYGAKRTSYNTRGGVHYDANTDTPSANQEKSFRKNYAGIGYTFDAVRNAFYDPKPYPSWVLNETTCWWEAPIPKPEPNDPPRYDWDEATLSWVEL